MNGDMPHVPITTLAGIASLTDLLNQLPLPSPLPATTAKSLLYNGRISDEVSSLLVCRDENLVTQLAHSLNQVSTEHIELKDNLGNDEPEGDMPILLQTLLTRNPRIFRDKSMLTFASVLQQPLIQQYKISQNQVHGSPASNYQQSPSGCFTSPQCGSATQFVPQQNSPIPSPYTPQSPADYIQYNPPSYSHQTQQVVSGARTILDNKISEHLSSNSSNRNSKPSLDEDYVNVAQRLGNEVMLGIRPRPPLIMQSPPLEAGTAPDLLLTTADRKKKQRERNKEENENMDKNVFYDIVSSPSKDSARLTLKLSRVKIPDTGRSEELLPTSPTDSDHNAVVLNNDIQSSGSPQDFSHKSVVEEHQQDAAQPITKETGVISGIVFDDSEIDAFAEIERIDSANERERCSKEVQDKDKPLKKRKQDTYPQEPGVETNEGPSLHGGSNVSRLTPKKSSAASNGASRPALMVSIDLKQAGRVIGQPVVVLEQQPLCDDHIRRLKTSADTENRPGIIKKLPDTCQMHISDGHTESNKQKQNNQRESKRNHDSKLDCDKGHSEDRHVEMTRLKQDRHSDFRHKEEKNNSSHRSQVSRPETLKSTSKVDRNSKHEEQKGKNKDKDKERDRQRDKDGDKEKLRDKEISRERDKDKVRDRERNRERDKSIDVAREEDKYQDKVKSKLRDGDKFRDGEEPIEREKFREEDKSRERAKDEDKDLEKLKQKLRDRDKDGEKVRERDKSIDLDKDEDQDVERVKDKVRDKDKIRDKEKKRERDKFRERDKDQERVKDNHRENVRGRDKSIDVVKDGDEDVDRIKDKVKDKNRDREKTGGKEKSREIDKDREKDRDKNRNRDKDENFEVGKEQNKDGKRDRERDKGKDRDRNRDRDRERDREKNKKHKTLPEGDGNRISFEEQTKAENSKLKQDEGRKSAELNDRQRTSSSSLQTTPNKDQRASGDSNMNQAANKRQACEMKMSEFPPFLLGGNSGSLKNFVIPKLKRDGKEGTDKDLRLKGKLIDGWTEPLVRLERVSLVKNLNKKTKPVIVVKRLSIEDVKRIIKETKNAHSSRSRHWASFDKSDRECEKDLILISVSIGVSAPRKRKKKDHDKSWKFEEKKGSRDHRRSGGFQNSRRGSSGRHRDWSCNDDSDGDSPPPSLNDVARKIKKQKSKMAYNSKMTTEEKMDSSAFKRFANSVDNILESLEDVDLTAEDDEIPQELLLGKQQLNELGSDSTKIKAMGVFNKFSSSKLVKILNMLEKNIQDSVTLSTLMSQDNDSMDEERLWRDLIMERVIKSADACLTALNIMTSPHMPKAVYIEDVIERVLQFTKFHLQNTLYPQYDRSYRADRHGGASHTSKSKRPKSSAHKQKVVVGLYNKVCDIISVISELLEIQLLTDTTILQVSNLGITPFFVENVNELQLCAISVVTAVFSRYEKHRQLILEEIFASLARLPTSKRGLRNFRLNTSDSGGPPLYIQMVSALVLQLIQCVVNLPNERETEEEPKKKVDKDILITNSYEIAMRTAQNFLSVFLKKCGSKQGEDDYRPLFENFVHDLLSAVNKPEWPAAELLLSLLGRLLVHQFSNKQTEMALRVASLDYLGTVASNLRKDSLSCKMDQRTIDRILKETPGSDEVQQLQKALLNFLDENIDADPALLFARKFYIAQWYRDTTVEVEKAMKSQNDDDDPKYRRHSMDSDATGEIVQTVEARKKFLRKIIKTTPSNFSSVKISSDTVDYEDSCLIVRYLASMRPFAQSFDIYLSQILRVLGESAIAVRTKAMKCLSEVVAVDPSILGRVDMQRGVHCRLMDNSTSVREAAVELLGRFVLSRPELIEQYYDMLIERILDTGISVRKRVIKILRDICLELPDFHKITEMCVRMIRRVNDEEGIKKLVNETFQKLWFSPTPSHDEEAMNRKILNITDVVRTTFLVLKIENISFLLLLKSEEDASYKPTKKACVQLVDNLVEHILKYEESIADCEEKGINSGRVVACITTLFLVTKIRPILMVKHAMAMQPYLNTKCNTQNDFMVICNVSKILELVVPLMENPSESFLNTIEGDLMKLIIKHGMTVVQHCVSCLGAIVNKVTHNYKFVWACFNRFYGALAKLKTQHQEDPSSSTLAANKPTLLRSLFTVGALCRHFDFDQEEFKGANKIIIKDKVLELLLYFTTHEDEEVQIKAIIGLGFQFIMHPELMFAQDVKVLYISLLSEENRAVNLKIHVLKNLQTYLQEEDSRMQEADREWNKQAKQEDLKEMGDISSGMSSSIMQIYLKQVLESFFHSQSTVRHFALNVITLTLSQGLIHPVQCVPYLVAMGTDPEPTMKNKADQQLVEIDKKYSGFIHMKAVAGLKMSYQVQQAINGGKRAAVRGFRHDDSDSALCSHLYSMVRGNRQHRRAFLISLLNLFDDSSKTEVNMLLFIADNLACFPYQTQEEPLFIMHHIDITLSVSGSNLLQSFKEVRVFKRKKNSSSDEEEEEVRKRKKPGGGDSDSDLGDEEAVMDRLPENTTPLQEFASASQGILLLLVLKQHLKNLYGFSDSKIQKYSPTESAKVYDKAVNRKSKVHFNPRQTLEYLRSDVANRNLSYETKRNIVKQFLDFKVLMEHLDRDEEDEDGGEANANARNKAINSLLKGPKPQNHNHSNHTAPVETDDEESEDEDPPAVRMTIP
uniref:Nipped-B protein n=1 Tax=Xiphophorus maculatus TaxID=8083 RepID=M3ZSI3_XIPMA